MPYIRPFCDCNNELTLTVHQMDSMDFRISNNGKIVKSSVKHAKEMILEELSCTVCGNLYDTNFDDKNRYIRGSLKREGYE